MFLLELHFSLDVPNSTSRTWSIFYHKQYTYVLNSDILTVKTLGQVEHADCTSKFMSKSKVSCKYYGFSKLIFLGLYFKQSHSGMKQLKTPRVKKSNPICDNTIEQQKISSSR